MDKLVSLEGKVNGYTSMVDFLHFLHGCRDVVYPLFTRIPLFGVHFSKNKMLWFLCEMLRNNIFMKGYWGFFGFL